MLPAWVDEYFPPRGPCPCCGGDDARHRIVEAIVADVRAGESTLEVARAYGVTAQFVERLVSWRRTGHDAGDEREGRRPSATEASGRRRSARDRRG